MIEVLTPKDRDEWLRFRAQDITSTEVAALFDLSPYTTVFELWHRKKDKTVVDDFEENERMRWGTRLQDSIAAGIAEDQGWKIRRMDEYVRDPDLKMGSSFDFAIEPDCECGRPSEFHEFGKGRCGESGSTCERFVPAHTGGLLEIKNVDSLAFIQGWSVDGNNVEAPPHIELQVQHQLAVSGRAFAYIGALIGGNRLVLIKREPDEMIIKEIRRRVASFWLSVVMEKEPTPDFSKDAKFISRLYQYAEPGKLFDARTDDSFSSLLVNYQQASEDEKRAAQKKEAIKAEILTKIGDAEKVLGAGYSIDVGITAGGPVSYERKPFRRFKPSFKKSKENN